MEGATWQGIPVPGSCEHPPISPPSSSQQGNRGLSPTITRNGTLQITGMSWKAVKPTLSFQPFETLSREPSQAVLDFWLQNCETIQECLKPLSLWKFYSGKENNTESFFVFHQDAQGGETSQAQRFRHWVAKMNDKVYTPRVSSS